MSEVQIQQFSLCGIRLDAMAETEFIELIESARTSSNRILILNHNLHSLFLYESSASFRDAYRLASYVYIDGMPVVWIAQAAGLPVMAAHRITFLHHLDSILAEAALRCWRVYYLGSTEAVLNEGLAILRERHPQLLIEGRNGFFAKSGPETQQVIAEINAYHPDLLFVGLGMPTQEAWLAAHYAELNAAAVTTSGATLDYVTGHAYKPPAWAGPLGLYGIFRLFSDPKRLWRRYLLEPVFLVWYLGFRVLQQRWRSPKATPSSSLPQDKDVYTPRR